MSELERYLQNHFLTGAQFAARCAIPPRELDRLLDQALAPQPAYVVTADDVLVSPVFGCLAGDGARSGRYFHPGSAPWISTARRVESMVGTGPARRALKEQFVRNYSSALAEFQHQLRNRSTDDDWGDPAGFAARVETAWLDFMRGVFGVCVADPSSERAIARKEALQETLVQLTDDGTRQNFTASDATRIRSLVDEYARCAMPFAPQEFARSSRRRLVDELRPRLAQAAIRP